MTCGDVRGVIAAYVDGELAGAQRLRVSRHLVECGECAREESGLRELGEMLRGAARLSPVPMDGLEGLAPGVVSRIRAEDRQSFRAKFDRVFEDWHWVAVGSGAFSAAFISVVFVFTILYSPTTQARQMNERVGTLYVMVVPEDGQGEPVILEFERALGSPKRDHRYAVPASFGWKAEQLLVTALDSSLMRHGGSVSFRELSDADREEVAGILNEIGRLRSQAPARRPGGVTNVSGMHLYISDVVTASGL